MVIIAKCPTSKTTISASLTRHPTGCGKITDPFGINTEYHWKRGTGREGGERGRGEQREREREREREIDI